MGSPVATAVLLTLTWAVPLWQGPDEDSALTITTGPQLRGAGTSPESASDAGFDVDVQVDGAGAGESVAVEMWSEGDWIPEDEGVTDADGHVRLAVERGRYGRVVADVDGSRVTEEFTPSTAGPALFWNEEFAADTLAPEWLAIPQPDDGLGCTMTGEEGTAVSGGQLALTVVEDPAERCDGGARPVLVNGHQVLRVVTGYGTTAARIRFPQGRSVSAQFWLQPGDPLQRWAMDDEHEGVVIAETRGTDREPRLGTSVNRVTGNNVTASSKVLPLEVAPTDGRFHVYAVSTTPAGFTFSIDGEVVRTVEATTPAPPLTIGLSVFPTKQRLAADQDERTMYVDWLRCGSHDLTDPRVSRPIAP